MFTHAHPPSAQPSIAYTTPPFDPTAHYSQLDDAHRIERVIRRLQAQRGGPEAPVEFRDFARAEETCHLSRDEIEALLPEVTALLAEPADPLAAWDREKRRDLLVRLFIDTVPPLHTFHAVATAAGFHSAELANLWGDAMNGLAQHLERTSAPAVTS